MIKHKLFCFSVLITSVLIQVSINITNIMVSPTEQALYQIIRGEIFIMRASALILFLLFTARFSGRNEFSDRQTRKFILVLLILTGTFLGQTLSAPINKHLKYKTLERLTEENEYLIEACYKWYHKNGSFPDSLNQLIPGYLDVNMFTKNQMGRDTPLTLLSFFTEKEAQTAETGYRHYRQGNKDFMELYFFIPYKNRNHMKIIWNSDMSYPDSTLTVGDWAVENNKYY